MLYASTILKMLQFYQEILVGSLRGHGSFTHCISSNHNFCVFSVTEILHFMITELILRGITDYVYRSYPPSLSLSSFSSCLCLCLFSSFLFSSLVLFPLVGKRGGGMFGYRVDLAFFSY